MRIGRVFLRNWQLFPDGVETAEYSVQEGVLKLRYFPPRFSKLTIRVGKDLWELPTDPTTKDYTLCFDTTDITWM